MRMRPMCGLDLHCSFLAASAQGCADSAHLSLTPPAQPQFPGNHHHWHRNRSHQFLVNRRSADGSNLYSFDLGMHDATAEAADRISLFAASPRRANDPFEPDSDRTGSDIDSVYHATCRSDDLQGRDSTDAGKSRSTLPRH